MPSKALKNVLIIIIVVLTGWLIYAAGVLDPLYKPLAKKPKVIGAIYQRQHQLAVDGMKVGMEKLGYGEKDLKYEEIVVTAGPNYIKDIDAAVNKLIADKVDIFYITSEQIQKEVLQITKSTNLPIVFMTRFHDPLAYGLVDSYKSSGNNSTGVATNLADSVQKTLFFFKEINHNAKKIGVFSEGFMVPGGSDAVLAELKKQGPKFGLAIVEYKSTKPADATSKTWHEIADKIKPGEIDGLYHMATHYYDLQEVDETALASRLKIPHAVPASDMPTGGSFSYGDNFFESGGQGAVMIDKIFNGAKPADIPIEYGAKNKLILNLKRAKDEGITFPDSMLSIASEKIDK